MSRAYIETTVERVRGRSSHPAKDTLAVEDPLEIQLGYGPADARATKSISVTMRTPGYDFELAAGFLMTEGVIRDAADIDQLCYAPEGTRETDREHSSGETVLPYQTGRNIVRVDLAPDVTVTLANLERNFYTTSSCGICGKASLLALQTVCPPRVRNTFSIAANTLYALPARPREAQTIFGKTGGLHGAGLFDSEGELVLAHEDGGRHNAVDKLLGAEFLVDHTPYAIHFCCSQEDQLRAVAESLDGRCVDGGIGRRSVEPCRAGREELRYRSYRIPERRPLQHLPRGGAHNRVPFSCKRGDL